MAALNDEEIYKETKKTLESQRRCIFPAQPLEQKPSGEYIGVCFDKRIGLAHEFFHSIGEFE